MRSRERGFAIPVVLLILLFLFLLTTALINIWVSNQKYATKVHQLTQKRFLVREGFKVAMAYLRDNANQALTVEDLVDEGWATEGGIQITSSAGENIRVHIFPYQVLRYYINTAPKDENGNILLNNKGLPASWDWQPWRYVPSDTTETAEAPLLLISRVEAEIGKEVWGIMVVRRESFNYFLYFAEKMGGGWWYTSAFGADEKFRGPVATNSPTVYIWLDWNFWRGLSPNSPESAFRRRQLFDSLEFTGTFSTYRTWNSRDRRPGFAFLRGGANPPEEDWQWKAIARGGRDSIQVTTKKEVPEGEEAVTLAWGSSRNLPPSDEKGLWINFDPVTREVKSGLYVTDRDKEVNAITFDVLDLGDNKLAQVISIRYDSNPKGKAVPNFETAWVKAHEINVIKVPEGATLDLKRLQEYVQNYRNYAQSNMNVVPYLNVNVPDRLNKVKVKIIESSSLSGPINLLDELKGNEGFSSGDTVITGPATVVLSPSLNTEPAWGRPLKAVVLQGKELQPKPVVFADANIGREDKGWDSSPGVYWRDRGYKTWGGISGIYAENIMVVANPDKDYDIRIQGSLVPYGVRITEPDEYDPLNDEELPSDAKPSMDSDVTIGLWGEKVFIGRNALPDWYYMKMPTNIGIYSTPTGIWLYAAIMAMTKDGNEVRGLFEIESTASFIINDRNREFLHIFGSLIMNREGITRVAWLGGMSLDARYDRRYAQGLSPYGFPTTGRYRAAYVKVVFAD